MAMLLDGPPTTIDELSARDSDLLNVAVSESIDLTVKLRLAASDVGAAVESMLMSVAPSYGVIHACRPTLRHIAVTPPLKLWHTYTTLRLIYQDLYFSRLNDRYQAKMKLYSEQEAQSVDDLRTTGLGVVFDPLPQALAPSIAIVQTSDTGGTLYLAVSFVNGRDEEGLISVPIEADTSDGSATSVTLAALADNAVGWNLYAGLDPGALMRQNSETLDPMASVAMAPGRLTNGPKPGTGQHANSFYPVPRRILRG
jgi:hypothetical protein